MPAIVARSVIASRNSDPPPSENLTNTALDLVTYLLIYLLTYVAVSQNLVSSNFQVYIESEQVVQYRSNKVN